MKKILLHTAPTRLTGEVQLNGSKSISNRLLLIEALSKQDVTISGLSNANDTIILTRLLQNQTDSVLDAEDAGTTYRFMTAYLACQSDTQVLTGSKRMLERPIKILAEALNELGAQINYLGKAGYPPLSIRSPKFVHETMPQLNIPANLSSQYISALLMIAPSLPKGLRLRLEGEIVSEPYITMTTSLMQRFGVEVLRAGNTFLIEPQLYSAEAIHIEADWSAASYYYAIAALNQDPVNLQLHWLEQQSSQGDAIIAPIMELLGVQTDYLGKGKIQLSKLDMPLPDKFTYDFTNCPDLAQTLAVVLAGLDIPANLTGLRTLRIKETDRIAALKTELEKLGAKVKTTEESLQIVKGIDVSVREKAPLVETYKDHRMAMAFAPLALRLGQLKFDNREVVNKSYPDFWKDLEQLGFKLK